MLDAFRASGLKRGSFKDGKIISDKAGAKEVGVTVPEFV
jgi:hypothetical protein